MTKILVILCDQLSVQRSSLKDLASDDVVLMCEPKDEFSYVKHHKKKIAFQLSYMRHFRNELENLECKMEYVHINDSENSQCLITEIKKVCDSYKVKEIIVTWPYYYRLLKKFKIHQKNIQLRFLKMIDF